jgi:Cation transport ATPase
LCKGADTVILPRLQFDSFKDKTVDNLEAYANQGLRTFSNSFKRHERERIRRMKQSVQ